VLEWSETHDPAGGLHIVATIWRYCLQENLGREGIGYFRRFLDRYGTPDALRAISLVHLARLLSEFDHEQALAIAREGASLALAIGDLAVEAEADPILAGELTTNGLPDQAKRVLVRFAEVANELNDPHVDVQVLLWKGIFELQTDGDPVVAAGYFSSAGAQAERIGDTFWLAICLLNEAESLEIAHRPGALDLCRRGVDLIRPHSSGSSLYSALTGLSMLEARHGSIDVAVGALREAAALSLEGGLASMISVFEAAEAVALVSGRASDVARLAGAVDQVNRRTHMVLPEMQESIAAPERTAARKMMGELKWEAAFRMGQADDPRLLVAWVMDQDWNASHPVKVRSQLRHGNLTRREVEVLGLVAGGRSDAEIAEALFISPKTASVHVSNIKGKLGLATRLEVALAARDLELGPELPHVERGIGSAEDPRTILDSI
jgi:DNA-binding NarL/FixJ family response regulator